MSAALCALVFPVLEGRAWFLGNQICLFPNFCILVAYERQTGPHFAKLAQSFFTFSFFDLDQPFLQSFLVIDIFGAFS